MTFLTNRRWAIIFFVSLLLNVFLIGVVAAEHFFDRRSGPSHRASLFSIPWAVRVIGKEVRPQARELFQRNHQRIRSNRRQIRDSYLAVNAALAMEPFDRQRYAAALADLRATTATAQESMHGAMAEFTEGLSPDQRRKLSKAVEAWAERRARRGEKRRKRFELEQAK